MNAISTTLPDPFLVLDTKGMVLMANQRAIDSLEMDPVNKHLAASLRAPALLEAFDEAIKNGQPVRKFFERRGQLERLFEAFITHVGVTTTAASGGKDDLVIMILRDFSAQQQMERMRADFVANASHELRTPLTTVFGFIETLQGAARDDQKARDRFLGLMRSQAERMRRLIDDLLSLSRIELNVHQRPTERVNMDPLIRYVCETLTDMAQRSGIELSHEIEGEVFVTGDQDDLVQVAQNLIENAIKYGRAGGRVEITCKRDKYGSSPAIVISVRDYGPGIAAEHLPRLTERFYRVSVQESRERGGTGLGLAIVKHIINRHRGRLEIESEPEQGSTFTVKLPASD